MHEPRWYHERWAILMLVLLVPPLGLLAAVSAPAVGKLRKLGGTLALLFTAAVLGAIEREEGILAQFSLDLAASVQYQRSQYRFAKHDSRRRIEALERACRLEPPPGESNMLGQRPSASDSAYQLGKEFEAAGDLRRARLALAAAIQPWAGIGSGRPAAGSGKPAGGPARYEAASGDAKPPPVYGAAQIALATVEFSLGLVERAADRLNASLDARRVNPDDPALLLLRGRLLSHNGNFDEARAVLLELVWRRQLTVLADAHDELARIERKRNRPAVELVHRLCAIRSDPARPELLERALDAAKLCGAPLAPVRAFRRAVYLHSLNRAGAVAAALYERIVQRHPKFAAAAACLLMRGSHLEYDLKMPAFAAPEYRRACELAREPFVSAEAHYKLGHAYSRTRLNKGAREAFNTVLQEASPGSYYMNAARRGLTRLTESSEVRERMERLEEWVDDFFAEDEVE